jgi:crossover junction endodeoxyribonuclease RuvC
MVIFGIDPGSVATGYGVIRTQGNSVFCLDAGAIVTKADAQLADRLTLIYDGLLSKLREFSPQQVCVEQAFYGKNVHTTLVLGHARGVALLAARKACASIVEFSPREIKKSVVGNGNAAKEQVEYMVKTLLSIRESKMRSDAFDALAAALCGFFNAGRLITASQ